MFLSVPFQIHFVSRYSQRPGEVSRFSAFTGRRLTNFIDPSRLEPWENSHCLESSGRGNAKELSRNGASRPVRTSKLQHFTRRLAVLRRGDLPDGLRRSAISWSCRGSSRLPSIREPRCRLGSVTAIGRWKVLHGHLREWQWSGGVAEEYLRTASNRFEC